MASIAIVDSNSGNCVRPFGAMNTIADLRLQPLWVAPNHLVETAIHIMAGHRVKALGVLDGDRLIGTVSLDAMAFAPKNGLVGEYVHAIEFLVNGHDSVRSVAKLMVEEGLEYVPAADGERYLGIVTPLHLLRELGRSYDPLTGLSWSDRLREWGVEHLQAGNEVTILFFDLDDFGMYNKRYGHIVGDRVLQAMAEMLSTAIDPVTDLLVRFGGDEFAIGTLRNRGQAERLAEELESSIDRLIMPETGQAVQFSVGLYGGRRTREREPTHFAATLDNLINFASRECMESKRSKQAKKAPDEPAASEPVKPRADQLLSVAGVYFDERSANGVTTVILTDGNRVVSGAHSRGGKPALESIAIATLKAIERSNPAASMSLGEIHLSESGPNRIITVTGLVSDHAVSAAHTVEGDLYQAAAMATVSAFGS